MKPLISDIYYRHLQFIYDMGGRAWGTDILQSTGRKVTGVVERGWVRRLPGPSHQTQYELTSLGHDALVFAQRERMYHGVAPPWREPAE